MKRLKYYTIFIIFFSFYRPIYSQNIALERLATEDSILSTTILEPDKTSFQSCGIEAYETGRYADAVTLLEKACKLNPQDKLSKEYLYWSYIFMNRTQSAKCIYKDLSEIVKSYCNILPKLFSEVFAEGGVLINKAKKIGYTDTTTIEQYSFDDINGYSQVMLRHDISRRISIYHGINYYNITGREDIDNPFNTIGLGDVFFKQYGYLANINIELPNSWNIVVSGTLFKNKNKYYELNNPNEQELNEYEWDDYIYYETKNKDWYDENEDYFDEIDEKEDVAENNYTAKIQEHTNYMVEVRAGKYYKKFGINVSASYGKAEETNVLQPGIDMSYFPFSNLNLYSITSIDNTIYDNTPHWVFQESIGAKLHNKIWFEAAYAYGDMQLYHDADLHNIYTMMYKSKYRISSTFTFLPLENFKILLTYKYMEKKDPLYKIVGYSGDMSIEEQKVNSHNIILGAKWIF